MLRFLKNLLSSKTMPPPASSPASPLILLFQSPHPRPLRSPGPALVPGSEAPLAGLERGLDTASGRLALCSALGGPRTDKGPNQGWPEMDGAPGTSHSLAQAIYFCYQERRLGPHALKTNSNTGCTGPGFPAAGRLILPGT